MQIAYGEAATGLAFKTNFCHMFPTNIKCTECGGNMRIAFGLREDLVYAKIRKVHKDGVDGKQWPDRPLSFAVYFCEGLDSEGGPNCCNHLLALCSGRMTEEEIKGCVLLGGFKKFEGDILGKTLGINKNNVISLDNDIVGEAIEFKV